VKVLTDFVGSWDDPVGGRDVAFSQHGRGVDVIFHVAGGTGTGIIRAAKEKRFYAIGVDSPQEYLAPEAVLTSMVKRCDVAVYSLIREKLNGTFQRGKVYSYGLKEGGVGLSWWSEETKRNIPPDVKARLRDLEREIVEGKITVREYGE
jgi:basic membrane protein A